MSSKRNREQKGCLVAVQPPTTPQTYTAPLEKVELSNKPTLRITQKLRNQINFLHGKQGGSEWSGELITSEVGSINDLDKWKITAEEMFLADLGSPGYTGYEVDKGGFKSVDIVEFYEAYPGLLDGTLKNHHIHTHHRMGCFFSGTDWSQLNDRSLVSNYFLMLIVNIAGDAIAKVAFKAKRGSHGQTTLEFSNNSDGFSPLKLTDKGGEEVLVVMDCTIEHEVENVEPEFKDRYTRVAKAIKEQEELDKEENKKKWSGGTHNGSNGKIYYHKHTNTWESYPERTYNTPSLFPAGKKISEMSQKEWEEFEKNGSTTSPTNIDKWDLRHARAMINCTLLDGTEADYRDCRDLLLRTDAYLTTDEKRDKAMANFEGCLLESYQVLFPRKMADEESYYDLLEKMVEYLLPYKYISIVGDMMECIENEMEETKESILKSKYDSPFSQMYSGGYY